MHDAEAYLAHMLSDMSERNYEYDFDVDSLLHGLFDDSEFPYSEKQKQAMDLAHIHYPRYSIYTITKSLVAKLLQPFQ